MKFDNFRDAAFPLMALLTRKKDCMLPAGALDKLGLAPGSRAPLTVEILEAARTEVLSYSVDTGKTLEEESWGSVTDKLGRRTEAEPLDGILACLEGMAMLCQTSHFAEGRKRFPWKKFTAALLAMDFAEMLTKARK